MINMINMIKILLISTFFMVSLNSFAMDFYFRERQNENSYPIVNLTGIIANGDTQRLASMLMQHPDIGSINLDSDGGDVLEAIRMGELIRAYRIHTTIQARSICASACFFLWFNGATRMVVKNWMGYEGEGKVGLHRPYFSNTDNTDESLENQRAIILYSRTYLEERLVPRRLIDIMMSKSSAQIYWINDEDLDELSQIRIELDELYLNKCGPYVVPTGAAQDIERFNARGVCVHKLELQSRAEIIKKLRSGWLPPLP